MNRFRLPVYLVLALPLAVFAGSSVRADLTNALASKPDAANGEQIFRSCISCHGVDGSGVTAGSTPRIGGQHFRVLVGQLVDFRHGKRWDFRMEDIAKDHYLLTTPQDIADVAFFVSRLGIEGETGIGNGQYVERGSMLYAALCASCHGPRADGNGETGVPRLAGQHSGYLIRQIYDTVDGRRPPLMGSHRRRFSRLTFEDVLGLGDYLARIDRQDETEGSKR
jgi:cytochrome c553